MPGTKKPRKPRRPRPVAIPVMPETRRCFEEQLHTSLAWLRMARTIETDEPLDNLAHVANVVIGAYPALLDQPAVAGASRTLNDLIERFVAHGRVVVGAHETASIAAGINALVERVATADVMQLHLAAKRIERERLRVLAAGARHERKASAA